MTSPAPRRIRVVGNSGAGKATVASAVARRLGLAHLELDGIYHLEGWQPAPRADFQASLERFLAAQGAGGWVIDGNYDTSVGDALDHADLVVWLDYPRPS
ncbi:hypothetical protein [Cellulomonas sp. KRMCY2]|uniref:hypothetical protein n=1 Tax=Cellulomonas sp. KRMCY2 TaxID=1304865 RepID=UPI0004B9581C|nr:hypothetical protein [Cellulomonas sp. KRMCY2]